MVAEPNASEPSGPRRERDPFFRFAVLFGLLAVGSELFYYAVALESRGFQVYMEVLARISGSILDVFNQDVEVQGARITSLGFSVEIARGCDAFRICALLASAMIAFPVPWRSKVVGLAAGLLWLNLLNFVRIVSLFFIGLHFSSVFRTAHEVVWPAILIVLTVATWIVWVRRATVAPEPA